MALFAHNDFAGDELRHEWNMLRKNTHLALDRRKGDRPVIGVPRGKTEQRHVEMSPGLDHECLVLAEVEYEAGQRVHRQWRQPR